MKPEISLDLLESELKDIYKLNGASADQLIEEYLDQRFSSRSLEERLTMLAELDRRFLPRDPPGTAPPALDAEGLSVLLSGLLGKTCGGTVSSEEYMERLTGALNTVFDSLNELIGGINATLMGRGEESDETIRLVISANLDQADGSKSLQSHLAQIKDAFIITHQAFKDAAQTKMREILDELDPENIATELNGSGLKFGPFHKAELYDIYKERYRTLKNWLDTGLLMDALLREFERACQSLYSQKRGNK